MALSWKARRRWSLVILLIGLPLYIVVAVSVVNWLGRPPFWLELVVYVVLGFLWILPFKAVFRGVGKAALNEYDMQVIGFRDGFRGLVENRAERLESHSLSGSLTVGGTILGTSRDKPHKMKVGGKTQDMTDVIVENYRANHLDALVCLGGGGTQKNALVLQEKGLNVITMPKTIDNDVGLTDTTFGFDTALGIATDAIDRLHSTAHSHHRIIVVEVMGHRAGWLTLGAGIAGPRDGDASGGTRRRRHAAPHSRP